MDKMATEQYLLDDDDERTPAERAEDERREAAFREEVQSYLDAGWRWDTTTLNKLVRPDDRDLSLTVDRSRRQIAPSPKLARQLRATDAPA
jgi:hypothetical protein